MSMSLGDKALETFLKNEAWRRYYEQAPSDACRRAIKGQFVRSLYKLYGAEYRKEALEANLSLEDWLWLYKWCSRTPEKGNIARRIRELGGEVPGEPGK